MVDLWSGVDSVEVALLTLEDVFQSVSAFSLTLLLCDLLVRVSRNCFTFRVLV